MQQALLERATDLSRELERGPPSTLHRHGPLPKGPKQEAAAARASAGSGRMRALRSGGELPSWIWEGPRAKHLGVVAVVVSIARPQAAE